MLDLIVGNNFLLSLIAFGLVLIPAIIIHELGHFLAAKAVGITVLEFGIGFPPRIARLFMWGETEFTLNWIPLGGFVRPLGEDMVRPISDEEQLRQDKEKVAERRQASTKADTYLSEREELIARGVTDMKAVNEVGPFARIFFMSAGAIANFLSAFILFVIIALIGLPQLVGARLQMTHIAPNSIWDELGVAQGDAVERINGLYFLTVADYIEQLRALEGQTATLTMRNIATNENYDITFTVPPINPKGFVYVASLQQGSPAEVAGIRPGDVITAIDGQPFTNPLDPISQIQRETGTRPGQPIRLSVLGVDGQSREVEVIPVLQPEEGLGRIGVGIEARYSLGDEMTLLAETIPQQAYRPQSLPAAISFGVEETITTFQLILEIPRRLLEGSLTAEEARPVSVIGISQIGGDVLRQSIEDNRPTDILNFIAIISVFLGVTQLLPIPALDGGRIVFVLIEIIRGKPISPERESVVHLVGIIVLLSLGVMIMFYDIVNPIMLQ